MTWQPAAPRFPGLPLRPRSRRPPAWGQPTAATSSGPTSAVRGRRHPRRTRPKRRPSAPHGAGKPAPGQPAPARTARARPEPKAGAGETGPASPAAAEGSGREIRTAGQTEGLDPVPAKAFSGRLLALGVVMIAITIMLAPTVKIFLEKRAEIAALEADISAKQAKQADLKRQVSRWQDPNYVKQQARDRINMVMPGETGYWVFGSDLPAANLRFRRRAGTATDPANLPWVDSLWDSIRRSATD